MVQVYLLIEKVFNLLDLYIYSQLQFRATSIRLQKRPIKNIRQHNYQSGFLQMLP